MRNLLKMIDYNLQTYIQNRKILALIGVGLLIMYFAIYTVYDSINIRVDTVKPNSSAFHSICDLSTGIFHFVFNFIILFCSYLLQDIELKSSLKSKILFFPVPYFIFFLSRLFIIIMLSLLFSIFYLIGCYMLFSWKINISLEFNMKDYIVVYIMYLNKLLMPAFGYLAIVVLLSFFLRNLIVGFIQLLICFFLSFVPDFFFLPSSYGYRSLRIFATVIRYPDSILKNQEYYWIFSSNILFLIVCIIAHFTLLRYYNRINL